MNHHVKKYEFTSESPEYKSASAEVKNNICEICSGQAVTGQIDKEKNIRWSCLDHIDELYKKMRKE